MKIRGSQTRELLKDTDYVVQFIDEHLVLSEAGIQCLESGPEVVLLNQVTGKEELWVRNDDFAGYVIEINGMGFEFVRGLKNESLGL